MNLFYVFTPIVALVTVWFFTPGNGDNDVVGKLIASVLVMILYAIFLWFLGVRRAKKRKTQIRGASLSPAGSKRVVLPYPRGIIGV